MDDLLRRSAAHVLVADVDSPVLAETDAHHLFRVLRLRVGEAVTITDGAGRWRACRTTSDGLDAVSPVVAEAATPTITVGVAIPKHDRPEWLVQKLTEIGVDRIVLLHARRSVVRWDGPRGERHLVRLRRVAVEAAMQSRRVWLPELVGPVDAAELLPRSVVAEPGGRRVRPGDTSVAIGPEGGWTDDELALAADRVGLGDTILRVETAALVAAVQLTALRH